MQSTPDEPDHRLPARPVSARVRLLMLATLATYPALLSAQSGATRKRPTSHSAQFLVYYGHEFLPVIADYRLAVLDSEMGDLAKRNRLSTRLGYLSLGQVHRDRSYFAAIATDGLLFDADPNWPDAHFVDLRSPRWRDRVVDEIVPGILDKGFRGIFIDTLDSAEALERRDPKRFAGMVDGAASLMTALRRSMPRRPIMVNRGYAVLPQIAGKFDMLLGESVSSTFDAKTKTYQLVPPDSRDWQVQRMLDAQRRDPKLRLFALDYWDPKDPDGIARLYAQERASGFTPYVATLDLTQIVSEP